MAKSGKIQDAAAAALSAIEEALDLGAPGAVAAGPFQNEASEAGTPPTSRN